MVLFLALFFPVAFPPLENFLPTPLAPGTVCTFICKDSSAKRQRRELFGPRAKLSNSKKLSEHKNEMKNFAGVMWKSKSDFVTSETIRVVTGRDFRREPKPTRKLRLFFYLFNCVCKLGTDRYHFFHRYRYFQFFSPIFGQFPIFDWPWFCCFPDMAD